MKENFDLKNPTHLIALFLVLFVLFTIPLTVISVLTRRDERSQAANTTAIYLSPVSSNVNVNGDLVVQVRENSGTTGVTLADITLTFDPTKLDFVQVDAPLATDPFNTVYLATSTSSGSVNFVRGVALVNGQTPVPITGDKLVATARFRAKTVAGAASITVATASVLYGASGADETSTRTGGNYTVVDPVPTVSLTAPTANSHVRGNSVTLSADATDNISVVGVEFYDGATMIGARDTTATGSTYSVVWNTTTATAGNHSLTARAFDANGSATSAAVSVVVDNTAPAAVTLSGLAAKIKGSVTVTTTATDTNLDRIEFRVDSGAVTTDNATPFTYNIVSTSLSNAAHTLTATAFDKAGNSTAATQNFTVDNQVPTTPTLSGTAFSETQINLSWTASTDTLSGPVTYDVFRGTTKITSSPVTATTLSVTGLVSATAYQFTVRAMDTLSNTVDSNILSISTKSPVKLGDINLDGSVNSADLAVLLATWGSTADLRADINNDLRVSSGDLALLISRWGT